MLKKSMFLNPNVDLEGQEKGQQEAPQVPDELCRSCPSCKKLCFLSDLEANCFVCPDCGHHFRISARERIALIADADSFTEINHSLTSTAQSTFCLLYTSHGVFRSWPFSFAPGQSAHFRGRAHPAQAAQRKIPAQRRTAR